MAEGTLTEKQIQKLSKKISIGQWEKIVLFPEDTGLNAEEIKNIKAQKVDSEAQSADLLRKWKNKNQSRVNQVKTLAQLLYEEAEDGNVDSSVVQGILGLTRNQAFAPDGDSGSSSAQQGTSGAASGATASSGKLTELKIRLLSKNITEASQLRDLGTLGLGVPGNIINKHLNERDITEAAFKVIDDWKRDTDEAVAYEKMRKALIAAGLRSYITSILEKDE